MFDSTSGNTGASEAYMCSLIKIPFYAVVRGFLANDGTFQVAKELEIDKVEHIKTMGGHIIPVELSLRSREAERLGSGTNAFFINQFGNADRAEESHESWFFIDLKHECAFAGGNFSLETTNVFHEILVQLNELKIESPDYFIHSAGTGLSNSMRKCFGWNHFFRWSIYSALRLTNTSGTGRL